MTEKYSGVLQTKGTTKYKIGNSFLTLSCHSTLLYHSNISLFSQ